MENQDFIVILAVILFLIFESLRFAFDIFKGVTSNYLYDRLKDVNARRTKEKAKKRINELIKDLYKLIALYHQRDDIQMKGQYIIIYLLNLFILGLTVALPGVIILFSQISQFRNTGIALIALGFVCLITGLIIGMKEGIQVGLVGYFDRQVQYRLKTITELSKSLSPSEIATINIDIDKITQSIKEIEQGKQKGLPPS